MTQRRVSVWGGRFWLDETRRAEMLDAARELDELGYARLWTTAGFRPGVPSLYGELLAATGRLGVASGILSIWHADPAATAAVVAGFEREYPGRYLLGLGASHASIVEARGATRYTRPYSHMVRYLDALDAAETPVAPQRRALAALGPRMLELAGARSAGAHPYFVPVEHTAYAREILGPRPLLAPEVAVVLESDPGRARAIAREHMKVYLALPNYTNNLLRLGYAEDDVANGGSDRLVDALIPWGDLGRIVDGITRHYAAGADEVAIQVLTAEPDRLPSAEFRALADALIA